jgi:hypothetical protein
MILRKPTAIPLRPEDLQAFQDILKANKGKEKSDAPSSRAGSEMNIEQSGVPEGQQKESIDAVEENRRARAEMTTRERLGIA